MNKELTTNTLPLTIRKKGWEIKKLGEVCEFVQGIQRGVKLQSEIQKNNQVRFLRIVDYTQGDEPPRFIDFPGEKYILKSDDIAIVRYGASTGFICRGLSGALANNLFRIISKKDNIITNDFLFLFLTSSAFQEVVEKVMNGAAMPAISFGLIKNIPIPIPPLPEQKRIVAILDKAFEQTAKAKANAEQNLKNAKELFENSLQILFDNKNWEQKQLGKIASFKNGMNYTKSSKGQSIEIVGVKNFKNNFWVPSQELEHVIIDGQLNEAYLLKKGDIITVRSNGNPKLIGRTLLADNVNGNISHSGFTIRIRLNSDSLLPVFLCHYLKTQKTRKELVERGNGVGIKSLNQGSLSSLLISFPSSLKEQQQIVERINELSPETKKLELIYQQKLDNLEELKKSILQKAFNGEL